MMEAVLDFFRRGWTFLAGNELVQIICLLLVMYLILRASAIVFLERRADKRGTGELIQKFLDMHDQSFQQRTQSHYEFDFVAYAKEIREQKGQRLPKLLHKRWLKYTKAVQRVARRRGKVGVSDYQRLVHTWRRFALAVAGRYSIKHTSLQEIEKRFRHLVDYHSDNIDNKDTTIVLHVLDRYLAAARATRAQRKGAFSFFSGRPRRKRFYENAVDLNISSLPPHSLTEWRRFLSTYESYLHGKQTSQKLHAEWGRVVHHAREMGIRQHRAFSYIGRKIL